MEKPATIERKVRCGNYGMMVAANEDTERVKTRSATEIMPQKN
jgi:hypothetical protein